MAQTKAKIAEVDPIWTRIRQEANDAIADEPLLGGLIHATILHHTSLEPALSFRISTKLASSDMSAQLLREIVNEAFASDTSLGDAARADLVAILDRDPACHRLIQPILYFKGFQAVQAYRVGHWLGWRAAGAILVARCR